MGGIRQTKKVQVPIPTPCAGHEVLGLNELPLLLVQQEWTNWCWAACIALVNAHRTGLTAQPIAAQCGVASQALAAKCCATPAPCDVGLDDDGIGTSLGRLTTPNLISPDELKNQVNDDKLVGVGIRWPSGGHMLVVYGVCGDMFQVYNPDGAHGGLTYGEIRDYGQGKNNWTATWENL